jgi:hypothetical protein
MPLKSQTQRGKFAQHSDVNDAAQAVRPSPRTHVRSEDLAASRIARRGGSAAVQASTQGGVR